MSCSSCHLDLRNCTFIKCAECIVPPIELCLPCFTGKFETKRHNEHHDYYVVPQDCQYRPTITGHNFDDVLMLLDSSRKFSVGSWEEMRSRSRISTAAECEMSFMTLYKKWRDLVSDRATATLHCVDSQALRNAILPGMSGLTVTPFKGNPVIADLPGFMPNRVDFEVEYDDSAELIIADIEFGDDDLPDDIATKLRCLHAFNERIHRRETIKQFAIDHRLVSAQVETSHHLCRSAEEVELRGKLRAIERHFPNATEYESFIQLLLAEARLVAKIDSMNKADMVDVVHIKSETPSVSNDDVNETKPVTRSRGHTESSRKGKTADEECARITDLLQREPTIFMSDVSSVEVDAMDKLGLGGALSFAAIRDLLLDRLSVHEGSRASLTVTRSGDLVAVRSSMQT